MLSFARAFPERCQIDEKSNSVLTISATSTDSIDDNGLVPRGFAIVGDDFIRTMISFELYGGDFTHESGQYFDEFAFALDLKSLNRF